MNKNIVSLNLICTFFCLTYPIYIYKTYFSYKHSWWFYTWNDSTQAISAEIITSLFGNPFDTIVWPGTTLLLPYLYLDFFIPHRITGNIFNVISLLEDIINFQRTITFIYALFFNFIFFRLSHLLTSSFLISILIVIAVNLSPSFAMTLNESRPELLSIIFSMLSALILLSKSNLLAKNSEIAGLLLGLTTGLSILSKIQILPISIFLIFIFILKNFKDVQTKNNYFAERHRALYILIILLIMMAGFIKSNLVSSAGMYDLAAYPNTAGLIAYFVAASSAIFFTYQILLNRKLAQISKALLFLFFGLLISIFLNCLPSLFYGGLTVFLTNINRLEFGIISVIFYGPGFGDQQTWGSALTLSQKFTSIFNSQSMSGLPVIGQNNIAFFTLLFLVFSLFYRITSIDNFRFKNKAALSCFILGYIFDVITILRLDGNNLMPAQYHIYSNIFYLLAIGTSVAPVFMHNNLLHKLSTNHLLIITLSIFVFYLTPRVISDFELVKAWNTCESNVSNMNVGIDAIENVAPSFFKLTNTSVEFLKSQKNIDAPCLPHTF